MTRDIDQWLAILDKYYEGGLDGFEDATSVRRMRDVLLLGIELEEQLADVVVRHPDAFDPAEAEPYKAEAARLRAILTRIEGWFTQRGLVP